MFWPATESVCSGLGPCTHAKQVTLCQHTALYTYFAAPRQQATFGVARTSRSVYSYDRGNGGTSADVLRLVSYTTDAGVRVGEGTGGEETAACGRDCIFRVESASSISLQHARCEDSWAVLCWLVFRAPLVNIRWVFADPGAYCRCGLRRSRELTACLVWSRCQRHRSSLRWWSSILAFEQPQLDVTASNVSS